ncbi:MAG: hypothetical protein EBV31_09675, partial [Verrucomicrobia bacterium]|nr:hypothetical protein [Verrucomicrobiota bacterium]
IDRVSNSGGIEVTLTRKLSDTKGWGPGVAKDAAKQLLKEMGEKERIKDTREAQEAKAFLLGL